LSAIAALLDGDVFRVLGKSGEQLVAASDAIRHRDEAIKVKQEAEIHAERRKSQLNAPGVEPTA
jgi:hypothetical protein